MQKIISTLLLSLMVVAALAQQKTTYEFAVKDTNHLKMDVYAPAQQNEHHACMIFVFGGGFLSGSRNDTAQVNPIMRWALDHGYVFVAIDYRLGLREASNFSPITGLKYFRKAINMASEDLLSSVDYILKNLLKTPQYTIDPQYIITIGSSAGAITVLQSDYMLCNRMEAAQMLPEDFHFAAVLSYSGAIFSNKGKVKYQHAPAPTLLCHGTDDRLVPYKQIQFCNLGLFGSDALAKRFEKFDYPYHICRYEGIGHEIAGRYRFDTRAIEIFLDDYVYHKRALQQDELIYDPDIKTFSYGRMKIRELKKFDPSKHNKKSSK